MELLIDLDSRVSTLETKMMTFHGADTIGRKIVVHGTVQEQFSNFEYTDIV